MLLGIVCQTYSFPVDDVVLDGSGSDIDNFYDIITIANEYRVYHSFDLFEEWSAVYDYPYLAYQCAYLCKQSPPCETSFALPKMRCYFMAPSTQREGLRSRV